ncbi:50S ribosomal protein L30 [uncultured archaeon]|nr:50S ribosomal protein L30 [uncultured archaeon]
MAEQTKPSPVKAAPAAPAKKTAAPAQKTGAAPKTTTAGTAMGRMKFAPGSTIAVVRIRGVTGMNPKRQMTLELLGIHKSHYATLVQATPIIMGMLRQAKDYISWGPASTEVMEAMLLKRGETLDGVKLSSAKKPEEIKAMAKEVQAGKTLKSLGVCRTFRLTPPSRGFKDRKKNYPYGDLGVRPSMDDALKAMI